jgi:hypothetical protein
MASGTQISLGKQLMVLCERCTVGLPMPYVPGQQYTDSAAAAPAPPPALCCAATVSKQPCNHVQPMQITVVLLHTCTSAPTSCALHCDSHETALHQCAASHPYTYVALLRTCTSAPTSYVLCCAVIVIKQPCCDNAAMHAHIYVVLLRTCTSAPPSSKDRCCAAL